jgi:hypothetical protein
MKNSKSFINIQKILDSNSLDAICWIMVMYDAKVSDMNRLTTNIKAKVRHEDNIKNAFFQDLMLDMHDDIEFLKRIFILTQENHPEASDKISETLSKIDEWKSYNDGVISKETSPIMFTSKIE